MNKNKTSTVATNDSDRNTDQSNARKQQQSTKHSASSSETDHPTKRTKTTNSANKTTDQFSMPEKGKEITLVTATIPDQRINDDEAAEVSQVNSDLNKNAKNTSLNPKFVTSPSKEEYLKIFTKNGGAKKLDFVSDENLNIDDDDGMSLPDEANEDEAQQQSEVAFTKRRIIEKQYGKYDSITKEEIFAINNYCRDSLWRRAKFINDRQLGEEFNHICDKENIAPENRNHKYVDIILLIQNNMNYRQSYTTRRMRELMVCK